jgi:predicted O-methyltransferase YrrM
MTTTSRSIALRHRLAVVVAPIVDILLVALVLPASVILKFVRRYGLDRLHWCRAVLTRVGVVPVRRHYYEPFTSAGELHRPLSQERELPGLAWNVSEQLEFLESLRFSHELVGLAEPVNDPFEFRFGNGSFESGDAEFLYQLIRLKKPKRVYEIGSGNSTLIARKAIRKNVEETGFHCKHLCIEPFEAPWLEAAGVATLRKRVEDVDRSLFAELEENDLLFIDSSHIIRPQGDVLTEYLEILPTLRPGVIVHVHDIFSPRDYLEEWVVKKQWMWNEQYLLEAFLTQNPHWKIVAALNLLRHRHFDRLREVCQYLTSDREPGSFYIQRVMP